MKFAPNIRLQLLGDQAKAEKLIGIGKSLVPVLQNLSSFQNLKQNSFTKHFGDDVVMTASHCFGQVSLDIWVRPVVIPYVAPVPTLTGDIVLSITLTNVGHVPSPMSYKILWDPFTEEILFQGTSVEYAAEITTSTEKYVDLFYPTFYDNSGSPDTEFIGWASYGGTKVVEVGAEDISKDATPFAASGYFIYLVIPCSFSSTGGSASKSGPTPDPTYGEPGYTGYPTGSLIFSNGSSMGHFYVRGMQSSTCNVISAFNCALVKEAEQASAVSPKIFSGYKDLSFYHVYLSNDLWSPGSVTLGTRKSYDSVIHDAAGILEDLGGNVKYDGKGAYEYGYIRSIANPYVYDTETKTIFLGYNNYYTEQ